MKNANIAITIGNMIATTVVRPGIMLPVADIVMYSNSTPPKAREEA
jgi:hypothetical protein